MSVSSYTHTGNVSGITGTGITRTIRAVVDVVPAAPDETTTGTTGALTPSAGFDITTGGTVGNHVVYEDLDITGRVRVYAPYVTIRNCHIDGNGASYCVQVMEAGATGATDATRILIEDCELERPSICAITGRAFTATRCNIHHTGGDGAQFGSHVIVEDCYFHHQADVSVPNANPSPHGDCMQMTGSNASGAENIIIRRNNLLISTGVNSQVSCLMIKTDKGPIDNVTVTENWLDGGTWSIYCMDEPTTEWSHPTNVSITNNRFGRNFTYGLYRYSGTPTITGNVFDDTGAAANYGDPGTGT